MRTRFDEAAESPEDMALTIAFWRCGMKKTFNEYQRFVARLFSACEIRDDYPKSAVLVDINKISDILEEEFIKTGLLKCAES